MARTPDPKEAEFVRRIDDTFTSSEPGRHAARRAAMQVLYQVDVVGSDAEAAIEAYAAEHEGGMPAYGAKLVRGVTERRVELDEAVGEHLTDWSVDRLGTVERAVLRIAVYELRHGEPPSAVVIDEAVGLAKRFASPDAGKLVNGVLGGWLRAHPEEERS